MLKARQASAGGGGGGGLSAAKLRVPASSDDVERATGHAVSVTAAPCPAGRLALAHAFDQHIRSPAAPLTREQMKNPGEVSGFGPPRPRVSRWLPQFLSILSNGQLR